MKNNIPLGHWYIGFGLFLAVCGILGFASNPTAAKTALISGGSFGALSALWGYWMLRGGGRIPYFGAAVTTLILCAAFIWRSAVSWQAVFRGEPKRVAAVLITTMLVGAVFSMLKLLRSAKEVC